jgi:hypothetical protein
LNPLFLTFSPYISKREQTTPGYKGIQRCVKLPGLDYRFDPSNPRKSEMSSNTGSELVKMSISFCNYKDLQSHNRKIALRCAVHANLSRVPKRTFFTVLARKSTEQGIENRENENCLFPKFFVAT